MRRVRLLSSRWLVRCLLLPALALPLWGTPEVAQAQTAEEIAGARDLAKQGADAFDAGEWQTAYDFFKRAESLYHAPPHLLYMARASEKLGRLVEAVELYNGILRENLPPKAPEAFRRAQQLAEEEIRSVEARVARVTISLEGAAGDQVEVRANGKPIPAALLGVPRPMDPGTYEFTAEGPTARAVPVEASVAEGGQASVVLVLEALPDAPTDEPVQLAVTPADAGVGRSKVPAYVALGVGAVGVGLGTFFLIDRGGKQKDADRLFESRGCGQDGTCTSAEQQQIKDLSSRAATSGTMSIVGFGVGAAAIGAGVYLLLTSGKQSEQVAGKPHQPHVRPLVGFRSVGLEGSF